MTQDSSASPTRPWYQSPLLWLAVIGIGAAVAGVLWLLQPAPPSSVELVAQAEELLRQGEFQQAEQLLQPLVSKTPPDHNAVVVVARALFKQDQIQECIELLNKLPERDAAASLLTLARASLETSPKMSQGELLYRAALEANPDNIDAHRELARILGLSARRHEAIPHILSLIRAGKETDLIILLARERSMIRDEQSLEAAHKLIPDDPLPLLGLAWIELEDGRQEQAIEYVREAIKLNPDLGTAWGRLGTYLSLAEDWNGLVDWSEDLPQVAYESPETWQALGDLARENKDTTGALRCYGEALQMNPESHALTFQMAQLLAQHGEQELAGKMAKRVEELQAFEQTLNRTFFSDQQPGPEQLFALIDAYMSVGRYWEATALVSAAGQAEVAPNQLARAIEILRPEISNLPLQLTAPKFNPLTGFDLQQFPVPTKFSRSNEASAARNWQAPEIRFTEDAAQRGLVFTFNNGNPEPTQHMYEFTGGGIAAIDVNRDELPDLMFTQGGTWPPGNEDASDSLFLNRGEEFIDITENARISDTDFGQGVATGDFNADGFPDFYVANVGANVLWENNGDGTFTKNEVQQFADEKKWTTSTLMADLNNDGLPDIYDVNYVTGADVFTRVCQGQDGAPAICMPFDFNAESDSIWINEGNGEFRSAVGKEFPSALTGKGLGIAAFRDAVDRPLALFVSNDTTPNFLFRPSEDDGNSVWHDEAITSGAALNEQGKAEGSMGIAVDDFNRDGQFDLYVTNFLAESNTVYENMTGGFFTDATERNGLQQATWNFLGFGTQSLDADLDGKCELFVTNGHIDDLSRFNRPYRMTPQLFSYDGNEFHQLDGNNVGEYFAQTKLGRSVATLDWNRDGRKDIVVGHLYDPTALLTNQSAAQNKSVTLRFVGQKNRDATGVIVEFERGGKQEFRQLTAGGGYQASNEPTLVLPVTAEALELRVHWPNNGEQYVSIPEDASQAVAIEGRGVLAIPN
ncbi:MAG: VCBS repeat-containing protein [Planctomycetaceae bacterium]|nr:VCBS repeat-containing protein [Planctomycetaceae bacterium]